MLQVKKIDEETERLKNIILRNIQVGAYAPDNKLPSEAQLQNLYTTDVYHVRKTISCLKKEGYLYSIPKFGVFVKQQENSPTITREKPEKITDSIELRRLSSRSVAEGQRVLWNEALDKFYKTHSEENFTLVYGSPDEPLPEGDMYEYSYRYKDLPETELLRIKDYFPQIAAYPELMPDPYSLPLYYSTCVLAYNEDILVELGFHAPCYNNFEEQQAFLEAVIRKVAKHKKYTLPGTSQPVWCRLGDHAHTMYTDLTGGITEKAFRAKYKVLLRRITDFWQNHPPSIPCENAIINYENFITGKTPFFFGWNVTRSKIEEDNAPFKWGTAMMYAVDDTFIRIPLMLAIRKNTKYPAGCLRLARILQQPENRQGHTKNGMIPLMDEEYKDLPFQLIIPPEKKGKVNYMEQEEYYIMTGIIGAELFDIVLRGKKIDDALADMYMFATGYHRMKQDESQTIEK